MPFLSLLPNYRNRAGGAGTISHVNRTVVAFILLMATLRVANGACFRV